MGYETQRKMLFKPTLDFLKYKIIILYRIEYVLSYLILEKLKVFSLPSL